MYKLFMLSTLLIVCMGYAADDPYSGYSSGQRYTDKNPPEFIKDNRPAGATEWPLWRYTSLHPSKIITPDQSDYQSAATRKFLGIPSLAISPGGRLWLTFFAGKEPAEDHNNYVVLSTSGDDGKTWKEVLMVDPDGEGPIRAFDSQLWLSPDNRLWLFWTQRYHSKEDPYCPIAGVWAMMNEHPDDPASEWSTPRRLTNGVMNCKPTVLSNGDWLFPASLWRMMDRSAQAVCSKDKGETFRVLGACDVPPKKRNIDEHMIVERKDGSLWMLVRTIDGIGESCSIDGGRSWSELINSSIQHPPSRFFIRRLNSGNLLLVKHGEIDKKIGRSHLTAFVSEDDGKTWKGGFLIDERNWAAYPDGQQAANGTIYITYDYNRTADKKIFMACFTEQDILAGKAVTDKVRLRVPVNSTKEGSVQGGWLTPDAASASKKIRADLGLRNLPARALGWTAWEFDSGNLNPLNIQNSFASIMATDGTVEIALSSSARDVFARNNGYIGDGTFSPETPRDLWVDGLFCFFTPKESGLIIKLSDRLLYFNHLFRL
ncbi:MAG: sialidase family protein [Anaerohalosphaeraceae bacterium]